MLLMVLFVVVCCYFCVTIIKMKRIVKTNSKDGAGSVVNRTLGKSV